MCGIVGYWGKESNVVPVLMQGLHRLEYRGYDSAGIACPSADGWYIQKAVGKVSMLEKQIETHPLTYSPKVGIAHTRWATHGVPDVPNTHPHLSYDDKIAVVHNGIIENYKMLKAQLEADGIVFRSKTDTEVITHLVAKYYKGDLKQAVILALNELEGAFAVAITSLDEPDRIIGAKKGSPLVLGVAADEIILASDVSAIVALTRDVIFLEDGEMVDIRDNSYRICDFEDSEVLRETQNVEWTEEQANKDGWEHFLIKEIMEQGQSVVDCTRGRLDVDSGNVVFGGLLDVRDRIKEIEKVIILGIGTSYYSAKLGEMYFEELTGIPTKAEMSPEFRYKTNIVDEKTWVIALSQSGETADTISAVQEAIQKGALVTGIVNTVGSTLSRITDAGVFNHIGPEISVASTKAFTSQALLLLLHAIYLGRMKRMSVSQSQEILAEILNLPNLIKTTLEQNDNVKQLASKYLYASDMLYIGRKFNYPIALEGALKLKEISPNVHAEGLSGGELKHGFIALIQENRPTIAIATADLYQKMHGNIEEIKARRGPVIGILNPDSDLVDVVDDYIIVPSTNNLLQPILNNIILQLFAYHISVANGFDVDKPRNLAKSVTVE